MPTPLDNEHLNKKTLFSSIPDSIPETLSKELKWTTIDTLKKKTILISWNPVIEYWNIKTVVLWDQELLSVENLWWVEWRTLLYKIWWNAYLEVEFYDKSGKLLTLEKIGTHFEWPCEISRWNYWIFDGMYSYMEPQYELEEKEAFKITVDPLKMSIQDWDLWIPLKGIVKNNTTKLLEELLDIEWVVLWSDFSWQKHFAVFDWKSDSLYPMSIFMKTKSWITNFLENERIEHHTWRMAFGNDILYSFKENEIVSSDALAIKQEGQKYIIDIMPLKTDWWKKLQWFKSKTFIDFWNWNIIATAFTDKGYAHILSWIENSKLNEVKLQTYHWMWYQISQHKDNEGIYLWWKYFPLVEITWMVWNDSHIELIFIEPALLKRETNDNEKYDQKYWIQEAQMILTEHNGWEKCIIGFDKDKLTTLWSWSDYITYMWVVVLDNKSWETSTKYVDFDSFSKILNAEEFHYSQYWFNEAIIDLDFSEIPGYRNIDIDMSAYSKPLTIEHNWRKSFLQKFILTKDKQKIEIFVDLQTKKPLLHKEWYFVSDIHDDQSWVHCDLVHKDDRNDTHSNVDFSSNNMIVKNHLIEHTSYVSFEPDLEYTVFIEWKKEVLFWKKISEILEEKRKNRTLKWVVENRDGSYSIFSW